MVEDYQFKELELLTCQIILQNLFVFLIPFMSLTDHNCLVNFSPNGFNVKDFQTTRMAMKGHKDKRLFQLDLDLKRILHFIVPSPHLLPSGQTFGIHGISV